MDIDVCLVSEGSYPYVTGGTGVWVHQLIEGLSDLRFGLVTLLPSEGPPPKDRYPVPPNVILRRDLALSGPIRSKGAEPSRSLLQAVDQLHRLRGESRCPVMRRIEALSRGRETLVDSLLTSRGSWRLLKEFYARNRRDVSFLDYFWTWRASHAPLFRLLAADLPNAAIYHTITTGYAGLVASLAKLRHGSGMIITEHGLYTREREIEIAQSDWIYQEPSAGTAFAPRGAFFKEWWLDQYRFMAQVAYHHADRIVTLHEGNRRYQLEAGAPADRLEVVPNGIDPGPYRALRSPRDWSHRPFRVGLVGRVVPIKDIKTFLRAIQIASREVPLEAHILGPLDEDAEYTAQCQELVGQLGLGDVVRFEGRVSIPEWLPRLDLHVLSSISESQPLVILETAAAGLPTVATDVGACREMLAGQVGRDADLGPSGIVVPVTSPLPLAEAILELARDPERHAAMGLAGIARVEGHYRQQGVLDRYRSLYEELSAPLREVG